MPRSLSSVFNYVNSILSWCWSWWCPMSANVLRVAEKKLLSYLKTPYRGWYVDIGSVVGTSDKIWTIALNTESQRMPLVLLHGLGAGVGLWCLNLDAFAVHRPVYAIDVLGFGRSSRPDFSNDAMEVERQLVQSVEEWRREMKLPKMILLGHSMGGFLAGAYALAYPERVKHLILADPWGLPPRPPAEESKRSKLPWWARALLFTLEPLNPLWAIRVAGPFGQKLVEKMRPDLLNKFSIAVDGDTQAVSQYIFQCNAQRPSGESAFHALNSGLGWAKNPLVNRIEQFSDNLPITIMYGSRSWMDSRAGTMIMKERSSTSYTAIKTIMGAGHHVYADKSEVFNETVNEICQFADDCSDTEDNVASSQPDEGLALKKQKSEDKVQDFSPTRSLPSGNSVDDTVERKEKLS
ncbi:1-acylglycerol-3-phosphate O-acyltransferase ABHD5-like isoform X2 [Macrosteles quadrilineatus]|uniref:1-acylglycerol-3-phosphate O-acyltransferase ABHD5-like isoform X2 n=1 Tax=Macrosteles quadrilineatus TaxID=74068 RepID=UPI0023E27E2A|nr:1-acylglycerol-3-phosphate O-acyltransferase ABHD5-like isoform X2 [Macrosteles quadrilineatus]